MESSVIKTGSADLQDRILAIIQLAFTADPFFRWIMPEAGSYVANFSKVAMAMAGKAFDSETAFYTEDYSAAALWLPPGIEAEEDLVASTLMTVIPENIQENMVLLGDEIEKYHPEHCWYLTFIGVDLIKQGRGLGASMLKHVLKRCDEDFLPAYLESSNPANISLYQRHGFEIMGEIHVGNPEALTPMIRQPHKER